MQNYKDLIVWRKAHELTLQLYRVTARFPRHELFGLTSQIRRSAASIGANIAEGTGRKGHAEFHRFLQMASGSTNELEYHFVLSRDLGYLNCELHDQLEGKVIELRKMLSSLINRVTEQRYQSR